MVKILVHRGIQIFSSTFSSATVIWDNDGTIVDGYIVKYGVEGQLQSDVKVINLAYTEDTVVDLNDLDEDTTYNVIISAVVGNSTYPPSISTFHTGLGPPRNITVRAENL